MKSPPKELALVAGDIIQNLRSSLDQLAYQLFIKNSSSNQSARHIYFPISKDVDSYNTRKLRDTEGLSATAKSLIDTVMPYKGGNDMLWQIHELNIIDKHRTLLTAGSSFQSLDLGAHMSAAMRELLPGENIPTISAFFRPADICFPLKRGTELFIDEPDARPNPEMQFRFNIILNEANVVEGVPLLEALQSMIDEVESLESIFRGELE